MIGVYDFCGHYDWTFEWLRKAGGEPLVRQYWDEAIHKDSQQHASSLILKEGLEGMAKYWGHTLKHEGAAYHTKLAGRVFRIDMHDCPSKGFLIQNGLASYHDYCNHCIGWIGPMLKNAGFLVDHEHNHCGQCYWEIRQAKDTASQSEPGALAGPDDVRLRADWNNPKAKHDSFMRSDPPEDKA